MSNETHLNFLALESSAVLVSLSLWLVFRLIGCADDSLLDFKSLMDERLTAQGFEYKAPLIPDSLQAIVDKTDAVSCDFEAEGEQTNPYWGKKILVLSGKKDTSSCFLL